MPSATAAAITTRAMTASALPEAMFVLLELSNKIVGRKGDPQTSRAARTCWQVRPSLASPGLSDTCATIGSKVAVS